MCLLSTWGFPARVRISQASFIFIFFLYTSLILVVAVPKAVCVAFIGDWKVLVDSLLLSVQLKESFVFEQTKKHMNVLEKETVLKLFLARHLFVHPHALLVLPPGLQRGRRVFLGALIHGVPAMANLHGAATCSGDA